ncbi:hypothetical protein [Brachybacterium hainanense]|uniref:DUF4352 domain-containing protein n=1 Tax=Brachybacterium hainanense TaxID=1541174 RepID=A0ABV6R689_9MICO
MSTPPSGSDPWSQPSGSAGPAASPDLGGYAPAPYEAVGAGLPDYESPQPAGGSSSDFSQSSFPVGGPAPVQPARGGGKGTVWALVGCAGCAVIVLLLVLVLGFVLVLRPADQPEPATVEPTATTESDPATTESDPATTEAGPTDDPVASGAPAAEGERGTLEAPLPAGTMVTVEAADVDGRTDVSLGQVNWNADEVIAGVWEGNEKPQAGNVFILVTVTYTYHGEGTYSPAWDLNTDFTGASGTEYTWSPVLTPQNFTDAADLTDGQSTTWDVAFEVSAEDATAATGSFHVYEMLNWEDEGFYVAAQ